MTRTSNRGVWMFDRCRPLWLALSVACTAAPAWAQTSPPTAPPTAGTPPPAAAAPALPAPPSSQDKMQRLSDEARIKHETGAHDPLHARGEDPLERHEDRREDREVDQRAVEHHFFCCTEVRTTQMLETITRVPVACAAIFNEPLFVYRCSVRDE